MLPAQLCLTLLLLTPALLGCSLRSEVREGGGKRWLIRYALCKQDPTSAQYDRIGCIIHAIVFVIREMPFRG